MCPSLRILALTLFFQGLLVQCKQEVREEIVQIPDPYFLQSLVDQGVDKNTDGLVSYEEAEAIHSLKIPPSKINDLTGLEAFTKLDSLTIRMNPLNQLDVSGNLSLVYLACAGCELCTLDISRNLELKYLDCSGGAAMSNELSQIDLSGNPALEILDCSENRLSSLDLSMNLSLRELNCGRNRLTELDVFVNKSLTKLLCNNNLLSTIEVSQNAALIKLITCGNRLSRLDVSENTGIVLLGVDNMSTIYEVCVWTAPFPPPGVVVLSAYSPHVFFTTDCKE